jgi:hypothetical protein
MSVGVDFFKSEFLFQTLDTEIVWTWQLTDDNRAMFYDVVPSPVPVMSDTRVEVTRTIQPGADIPARRVVELHVKLDYVGAAADRPALNAGVLNFHAIRIPGD